MMPTSFIAEFEYHISLHHSQTEESLVGLQICLNTIYLYIILKPFWRSLRRQYSLNTIYLYIILKHKLELYYS